MVVRLFVLLAVVCLSRGQTPVAYYDRGDGIYADNTVLLGTSSQIRKLCFDGDDLYFVDGDVDPSQIQILVGSNPSPILTIAGAIIDSLSCACDTLAFTYRLDGRTFLGYRNLGDNDVFIKRDIGPATATAVRLQHELGTLIVVSRTEFWKFTLDLEAAATHLDIAATAAAPNAAQLPNDPKCVAGYEDTGAARWYLFISFDYRDEIVVICFTNEIVSYNVLSVPRPDNSPARVTCLDVDVDNIYFLQESSNGLAWEINSYPVSDWLGTTPPTYSSTGRIRAGGVEDFDDCVNGLDICGTACTTACGTTCDCSTTTNCGFCGSGDRTCLCENSAPEYCCYPDESLRATCLTLSPPINAMCVVKNARAQRRKSDEVQVLAVSQVDAAVSVSTRTAKTGRWDALPIMTPVSVDGPTLWIGGFSAMTPSSGRGRRFGVFLAEIDPTGNGLLTERINCIVTEGSKFINDIYTYCGYVGGSVMLEARGTSGSQVNMNQDQLAWRFTSVDLTPPVTTGTPNSARCVTTDLMFPFVCRMDSLTLGDEGIYEVYRVPRRLRTWHPIFYLSVRECPDGQFGSPCADCNFACVNGKCDPSGDCLCFPGWMGQACEIPCTSANSVGQGCDIDCDDICPGATDCKDLLFFLPGKLGSYCRSGLQSPQCWNDCEMNTWGPNCENTCATPGCNARTGL